MRWLQELIRPRTEDELRLRDLKKALRNVSQHNSMHSLEVARDIIERMHVIEERIKATREEAGGR